MTVAFRFSVILCYSGVVCCLYAIAAQLCPKCIELLTLQYANQRCRTPERRGAEEWRGIILTSAVARSCILKPLVYYYTANKRAM